MPLSSLETFRLVGAPGACGGTVFEVPDEAVLLVTSCPLKDSAFLPWLSRIKPWPSGAVYSTVTVSPVSTAEDSNSSTLDPPTPAPMIERDASLTFTTKPVRADQGRSEPIRDVRVPH